MFPTPSPFGFGPGGGLFELMFTLVPVLVLGGFAFVIIGGLTTWLRNNQQPVLNRPARVVAKRQHVWGGGAHAGDIHHHHGGHTSYYATFEFEDGERLELPVGSYGFGQIAEGDVGILTHQGTRFHGFERERL